MKKQLLARFGLALVAVLVLVPTHFIKFNADEDWIFFVQGGERESLFNYIADAATGTIALCGGVAVTIGVFVCIVWCWDNK